MGVDWLQVLPAPGVGSVFGWLFRYVFVRWSEQRHLDEALNRGEKAVSLAKELLSLHEKACDRNVNMFLPLGKQVIELLPVTDEEVAEQQQRELDAAMVGQFWLVSLVWHCVNLHQLRSKVLKFETAIEHANESFLAAFDEFDATALLRSYDDVTVVQVVHSYHGYLTQGDEANLSALVKALENWLDAHTEDEENSFSE